MSGEFELIRAISALGPRGDATVLVGIGDDAALLVASRDQLLVATTDTLVRGVHFPRASSARNVGWKALAVNLSDLAAMGARPAWVLQALTLPRGDATWMRAFAAGFGALARRHRVSLVGGDTTRGPLSVTVTALGFVPRGRALRRDAARAGDSIWVSGTPGDAAAGLAIVQRRLRGAAPAVANRLRARLDRPAPRVALGIALRGLARAAIDVSDGLAQDLGHVLRASGVGAELDADAVPASTALRAAVPDPSRRRELQLRGGDDYELLFTAPPRRAAQIRAIAAELRLPLTQIGRVTARKGLAIRDAGGRAVRLKRAGYDHFA
jgi:thiamine-monophosphate kinase